MSDLTLVERLAKLRTLKLWLDWQVRDTDRKIADLERRISAITGYVTEQERRAGKPVGVTIHKAECTHIQQPVAVLTEAEARFALAKDAGFMHPCEHCHPEKELKPDWSTGAE